MSQYIVYIERVSIVGLFYWRQDYRYVYNDIDSHLGPLLTLFQNDPDRSRYFFQLLSQDSRIRLSLKEDGTFFFRDNFCERERESVYILSKKVRLRQDRENGKG